MSQRPPQTPSGDRTEYIPPADGDAPSRGWQSADPRPPSAPRVGVGVRRGASSNPEATAFVDAPRDASRAGGPLKTAIVSAPSRVSPTSDSYPSVSPERTQYVPGPSAADYAAISPGAVGGDRTEFVPGPSSGEHTEFVPGPSGGGDRTEYVPGPDLAEALAPPPDVTGGDPRWAHGELAMRTTEEDRRSSEHRQALATHAVGQVTIVAGAETGTTFPLVPKSTLGRSPDCTVTVSDGTVSAVHAAIVRRRGHLVLIDWDSKGGTTLNGNRVSEAALRDGDRIGLATVTLQVNTRLRPMPMWMVAMWGVLAVGTVASLIYLARGLWAG